MIEVKIPQEIKGYDAKLVGPFSTRQALCGAVAILLGYLTFNALDGYVSTESRIGIIMLIALPLGLIGWVQPYGMRFEQFFMGVLFNTVISASKRYFKSDNVISKIEKNTASAKEVKNETAGKDKMADKNGKKKNKKEKVMTDKDWINAQKRYKRNTFA